MGIGNVHLLQSQFRKPIEVLEQAVAENPDMPEALFCAGPHLRSGRFRQQKQNRRCSASWRPIHRGLGQQATAASRSDGRVAPGC